VAEEYASRLSDELVLKPLDRALLLALTEQSASGVPIADLGCGPGHVAAWLARRGRHAVGIDLSPRMLATGRRRYPAVEFREGDLLSLPAADAEFGAALALYSIIHLEGEELHSAALEMHRVLLPGALLLVAFHVGSEIRQCDEWWGHAVDIRFRFLEPDLVVTTLEQAGFDVEMVMTRTNYPNEVETRRAYLLARVPAQNHFR
jgi:ubiquinone/menaquinone biosynthesis C-methylase UbiE